MKKESKHNRNSKTKAECSCSIPEKGITNLAARAAQEGKETYNPNFAVAEQTGSETTMCCSGDGGSQHGDSVDGHRSDGYNHHAKLLQSPSNQEKMWWLQPVKACVRIMHCILVTDCLQTTVTFAELWHLAGVATCEEECRLPLYLLPGALPQLVTTVTNYKFPVFRQSAANTWMEHLEDWGPVCSWDFISPGSWGRAGPWSCLCSHSSNGKLLWCSDTTANSNQKPLLGFKPATALSPSREAIFPGISVNPVSPLHTAGFHTQSTQPCHPYKPWKPWWPWISSWPSLRGIFSSSIIPKTSNSACRCSHAAQVLSYRGKPKVGFSKVFSSEHSWDLTGETPGAQAVSPF